MLSNQTNRNFDLYIYDSGPHFRLIQEIAKSAITNIQYRTIHTDSNEGCWRRHELAQKLAKDGYKKILFLDDDIIVPNNYIELALEQYEEKSYKSWWAWNLNGSYYWEKDRTRVQELGVPVNYCGAGVSIMDASIFLDDEYFNIPIVETKWIDDVWLSFYSKEKLGWKLEYLDVPGVAFGEQAADEHSLYLNISNRKVISMSKKEYVDFLKSKYGWNPVS